MTSRDQLRPENSLETENYDIPVVPLSEVPSSERPSSLRPLDVFRSSTSSLVPTNSRPSRAPSINYQEPSGSGQFGIPSVRPNVDNQDRLWAEMDILGETAAIAQQAAQNKSFFGTDHAQALAELRKAQTELVRTMAQGEKRTGEQQYQSLWEQNDMDSIRNNLFNQQHFNNVYNHVNRTIDKLDQVSLHMKIVDERSKEMWQTPN